MNRRGFLAGILAAAAAPAIVRADSLMRIVPRETTLVLPTTGWWMTPGGSLDEIITETIRQHSRAIAANVTRHNALLRRLSDR